MKLTDEEKPCQTCRFKIECANYQKVGLPVLCDEETHEHYEKEKEGE